MAIDDGKTIEKATNICGIRVDLGSLGVANRVDRIQDRDGWRAIVTVAAAIITRL